MLFHTYKCKTLHFGYNIVNSNYSLGNEVIKAYDEERDLGVVVSHTLNLSSQYVAAAKSVNRILGMIGRTFANKNSKTMLKLYQSMVRPKLEYCVDCRGMETLLAKGYGFAGNGAEKSHTADRNLSYSERLKRLNITKLETRRLRGDLIQVLKFLKVWIISSTVISLLWRVQS